MVEGKTDLSTFDNSHFYHGNKIIRALWFLTNAIFFISPFMPFSMVKVFFLRLFGAKVGHGVVIKPSVNIKYPWRLAVGNNVWIGENVWIDNLDQVIIGDNSCISQGALLLTGNHNYKSTRFDLLTGKILLEDGVWIGAKAIVTAGVSCGSHAVLSAGSIASGNLLPYSVYRGNPATKIRDRHIV